MVHIPAKKNQREAYQ